MPRKYGIFVMIAVAAALLSFGSGCRGAAYRDVYSQKMASEIRNLEDQLYDADYQNQVLRDELAQAERRAAQVVIPQSSRPPRRFLGKTLDESGNVVDAAPRSSNQSVAPLRDGPSSTRREALEGPEDSSQAPIPAPMEAPKLPARPLDDFDSYQPPSEPVPPGASDLLIPDVELGEPVPPTSFMPNGPPEFEPGRITLPDTAKILGTGTPTEPVSIRINNGLSGAHRTDDVSADDGVELLVEAIDEKGKVVDLSQFEIDANLSVVLLDPSRSGETARLGKWDFGPDKIREMLKANPATPMHAGNLHVVLPWGTDRPASSTVIAHVRLSADDVMMQTQAEIATKQSTAANWTPRASQTR